ncbi:MAG: hypothetical protein KDD11_10405 [Acidobacteria bacterium]|nr:hypothetical protein [Acidobacteriota bacterium]
MLRRSLRPVVLGLCWLVAASSLTNGRPVFAQEASPGAAGAVDVPSARDSRPLVWLRYYKARPGLGPELLRFLVERDGPYLDSLVARGTLISWGVARPFNLVDDRWTHVLWLTLPGWTEADSMVDAMGQLRSRLGPEALAEFETTLVPDSRRDLVLSNLVVVPEPGTASATARSEPRYIRLGYHRAGSEDLEAAERLYRDLNVPLCQRLIRQGAVEHCGLSVQAVVSEPEWTHVSWVLTENLAGIGRYQTDFVAAAEGTSEAGGPTFWERYREVFDREAYRSAIYRILHLGAASARAPDVKP